MSSTTANVEEPQAASVLIHSGDVSQHITSGEVKKSGMGGTDDALLPFPRKSLDDYLLRNVLIATGALNTTDTVNVDLLGNIDPHGLFLTNTEVVKKVAGFQRIRCDMIVTIEVSSPSNAYGAYNFQALCGGGIGNKYGNEEESGGPTVNVHWTSTQDIHGIVNISLANNVELELPFISAQDGLLLPASATPNLWTLCLWALQPMRNGVTTSSVTATYNIYARLAPGYELLIPTFQGKQDPHPNKVSTKKSATVGKIAGGVAMLGAAVPALAPFAEPVAAGLAMASSVMDLFGYTRVAKPMAPLVTTHRTFSNIANVDGDDTSDVLGLFNSNALSIDPRIGGGDVDDPCSFGALFPRWTIVDGFEWATTDTVGTILRSIAVTPFYSGISLGVYYPTVAGFVGLPFKFWRGSMEYRFYIPVSVYHRGQLQIVYDPNSVTTYASDPTHRAPNVILDVTATNRLDVTVGYCQLDGGKEVQLCGGGVGPIEAGGCLNFRVNAQLCATAVTAPVRVIVMARAGPDMRFWSPRETALTPAGTVVPFAGEYRLQGGVGDEEEELSKVVLIPPSPCMVKELFAGEEFLSVRPLMQKFSFYAYVAAVSSSAQHFMIPHYMYPTHTWTDASIPDGVFTYASWYQSMFMGVRGSTRYKVIMNCGEDYYYSTAIVSAGRIDCLDNLSFTDYSTGAGVIAYGSAPGFSNFGVIQVPATATGFEVSIPAYDTRKYHIGRFAPILNLTTTHYNHQFDAIQICFPAAPGAITFSVQMWKAYGSDVSVTRFRRTPGIVLTTA